MVYFFIGFFSHKHDHTSLLDKIYYLKENDKFNEKRNNIFFVI
jgi:hypothetical protein